MKRSLPLLFLLMCASCVAREDARETPSAAQFRAHWRQAINWEETRAELVRQAGDAHPVHTALFGSDHADKPGLEVGKRGVPGKPQLVGQRFRFAEEPRFGDRFSFGRLPVPGDYLWRIPPGQHMAEADGVGEIVIADEALTPAPGSERGGVARVRVVFRFHPEPVPLELYRHGMEINVARWGYAVVPLAVEFADANGRPLRQFHLRPAK